MTPEKFLIAGFGGQGIIMMGTLLAQTGMDEDKHVTWFPSYGPAMRGGTANCSVILSNDEIASPIISKPDMLVAMNEESFIRFEPDINKNGLLLYNKSLVGSKPKRKDIRYFKVAATELAGQLGNVKIANMITLGALIKLTGILSVVTAKKALKMILPVSKHGLMDINNKALDTGYELF